MPDTCAVTAYFRIAPIAIRTIDVPIVMAWRGASPGVGGWTSVKRGNSRNNPGPRLLSSPRPGCLRRTPGQACAAFAAFSRDLRTHADEAFARRQDHSSRPPGDARAAPA